MRKPPVQWKPVAEKGRITTNALCFPDGFSCGSNWLYAERGSECRRPKGRKKRGTGPAESAQLRKHPGRRDAGKGDDFGEMQYRRKITGGTENNSRLCPSVTISPNRKPYMAVTALPSLKWANRGKQWLMAAASPAGIAARIAAAGCAVIRFEKCFANHRSKGNGTRQIADYAGKKQPKDHGKHFTS